MIISTRRKKAKKKETRRRSKLKIKRALYKTREKSKKAGQDTIKKGSISEEGFPGPKGSMAISTSCKRWHGGKKNDRQKCRGGSAFSKSERTPPIAG